MCLQFDGLSQRYAATCNIHTNLYSVFHWKPNSVVKLSSSYNLCVTSISRNKSEEEIECTGHLSNVDNDLLFKLVDLIFSNLCMYYDKSNENS